jgi:hypothetical protein
VLLRRDCDSEPIGPFASSAIPANTVGLNPSKLGSLDNHRLNGPRTRSEIKDPPGEDRSEDTLVDPNDEAAARPAPVVSPWEASHCGWPWSGAEARLAISRCGPLRGRAFRIRARVPAGRSEPAWSLRIEELLPTVVAEGRRDPAQSA